MLLYFVSTTASEASKRSAARAILDRDDLVSSAQVLQEVYVQATRTTKSDRLAHSPAPRTGGCSTLYSEDLQDGMNCAGMVVETHSPHVPTSRFSRCFLPHACGGASRLGVWDGIRADGRAAPARLS